MKILSTYFPIQYQTNSISYCILIKWKHKHNLPFSGDEFIGLVPECVCRRYVIEMGFDASLADDERFRDIGPKPSSMFFDEDIALNKKGKHSVQIIVKMRKFYYN